MRDGPAIARPDTPLAIALKARIREHGPLTIGEYMRACLGDPEHGYYRRRPAIGAGGDFVTAPEISQVFGELIGLWLAVVWRSMGSPGRMDLVELGPGRGTLLKDALRAARLLPEFVGALNVHLVESNATLAETQRAALLPLGVQMTWHEASEAASVALASAPHPFLVIGNEFLDTCAVEQYVALGGRLVPRGVGVDAEGALTFTLIEGRDRPLPDRSLSEGDIVEVQHFAFLDGFTRQMAERPGAALFIDYGSERSASGDTLQAVRAHTAEHPLASPGEADLTVHVDFERLAARIRRVPSVAIDGPVPQAHFLGQLGIVERASRLMSANPDKAGEIEGQVQRLLAPGGMGSRFKAIGVRSALLPPLPGLEGPWQ
jgi:SAM-dependent MidA family methyltransferase